MAGQGGDPWRAWSDLAGAGWKHLLSMPGATLLAEVQGLEQDGEAWAWTEERVWRAPSAWLFVRQTRRSDLVEDGLVLLAAATPEGLAREVGERLGRSPGLVELLGRAGIETGIAPDDQIEGDEIDDWPARPPGDGPPGGGA